MEGVRAESQPVCPRKRVMMFSNSEPTLMPRVLSIAAVQSGPISRQMSRSDVVARLLDQMREARRVGCDLIVFTECALTAFFPHWWIEDEAELDVWFEREMPGPVTQALFEEARRLGIGFYLGYAELAVE